MGTYFSKAQNLRMILRDRVNALLREVDVLVMPTTPQKPFKLEENARSRGHIPGNQHVPEYLVVQLDRSPGAFRALR